ncbi:MAG: ISAs1 family transposase [Sulfobacillus benefaciens]|uniref:ISAs1 family transposase n=1 Tax=Sulfobacillus benefaciens TaxID=453960 RepID=A0A2T2X0M0_9FIRM|nr:MAG: ISAs1 family transposase [Sulfobacillus benefaciens]
MTLDFLSYQIRHSAVYGDCEKCKAPSKFSKPRWGLSVILGWTIRPRYDRVGGMKPAHIGKKPVTDWAAHLVIRLVRPEERTRWRTLMAQHHYLGFRGMVGEALMYVACLDEEWVALLGWAAAAWMCRPRDQWIGWTRSQQWERLRFVTNNVRFLILPEVHIPHLASKTLALNTRRLSEDWRAVYGHPVVLAETFVDPARFAGTAYRAAGWLRLGETRGFARTKTGYVRHGHPKTLWVRPLEPQSPAQLAAPFLSPAWTGGALTMIDFDALNWAGPRGLRDRLKTLIDPRHRRGIRHSVDQILVLALGAVMAGQRTFVGMGDWIRDLRPEQRAVFGCPRWGETFKVPSEPTVRRLLQNLDADALDTVLNQWLTEEELRLGEVLARDGKSLRGSAHGARKRPVHLLSGLLHRTGQVVGPVDVDGKTNEIPQLKVLLDPLDIAGAIVTVDALHTQTETARYVVEDKHAHYVMEVKKNQPSLYEAIQTLDEDDFSDADRTIEKGHSRIETRRVRTSLVLTASLEWPHVRQVFRIDRHVTDLNGENPRDETAFGITDLDPNHADAQRIGTLVRGHWGIETR